ncbi:MAG: hypothetical protein ACJ74Q_14900 [Pyrinomonadaceae bacterium]
MTKQELEKLIFDAFLEATPDFKAAMASYTQPDDDPPDILCSMNDGQHIGFELKEWLNEEQMREAKGRERLQESIFEAIAEYPPNSYQHIAYLWLFPRTKLRVKEADREAFRTELFTLIEEIEVRWPNEPMWHSPQGHRVTDLTHYPTASKYLHNVEFFPQEFRGGWAGSRRWIRFPNWGGSYSPTPMVNALLETVAASIDYYRGTRLGYEFNLLIHYSQALLYNYSVETSEYKIDDAARAASDAVGDDPGRLTKIYLLIYGEPSIVYRLY